MPAQITEGSTPAPSRKEQPQEAVLLPVAIPARPANHPNIGRKSNDGKITVGLETTWLLEPIDDHGYVDYVEALNQMLSKGVTPENNGAVLFWRAMGPEEIRAKFRAEFFQRLGIGPLPKQGNYFRPVKPEDDFIDDWEICASRTWQRTEFPKVAAWLDGNAATLKIISQAVQKPAFYSPLLSKERFGSRHRAYSIEFTAAQTSRYAARALVARAMLHIGEGRAAEARDDLLTIHRLSHWISRPPVPLAILVGGAVESWALEGDRALASSRLLTAKQATTYRQQLRRLGPISGMARALDVGERFLGLDSFTLMARDGLKGYQIMVADGGKSRQKPTAKDVIFAKTLDQLNWNSILKNGSSD